MTGMTVLRGDRAVVVTEVTDHHFRALTDKEIDAYVASGEPMDKAGAYGIQGQGALLVEGIQGDYYTVVGLPVSKLAQMFEELSIL
jgi:septum formation protein